MKITKPIQYEIELSEDELTTLTNAQELIFNIINTMQKYHCNTWIINKYDEEESYPRETLSMLESTLSLVEDLVAIKE